MTCLLGDICVSKTGPDQQKSILKQLWLIWQIKAWLSMPCFCSAARQIKMFVLDEADEMLSRGFKDQIYEIFQKQSTNIQVRTFWIQAQHWQLKCKIWNPSALTEVCYNCVIQILSVSCNNASRVLRGRRLLATVLKMRCGRTSFLMFIGLCLKVQCHMHLNIYFWLYTAPSCDLSQVSHGSM